MTYAIFKVSWNPIEGQPVNGGIRGSAFFVDPCTAITANHVLNSAEFKTPDTGFLHCRFWLLGRDGSMVDCSSGTVIDLPEIDVSVVRFNKIIPHATVLSLSAEPVAAGVSVFNEGYSGGGGNVRLRWDSFNIAIEGFDLNGFYSDDRGTVDRIVRAEVTAPDVKLSGVNILKMSYGGTRGMSGGPLLIQGTTNVIGMMSFGLPPVINEKQELYAVAAGEILSRIECI
jgi:hypothetical protein